MNNLKIALHKIYLHPAELILADEPTQVTTVLGSCISVTLYSPRLKIGSICHAVLPKGRELSPSKFCDQSVHYMLKYFSEQGISPAELEAKLFGGAEMFSVTRTVRSDLTVGAQNILIARETLRSAGLEPLVADVGGRLGRKLVFYSHTGEVFRKWVKKDLLDV